MQVEDSHTAQQLLDLVSAAKALDQTPCIEYQEKDKQHEAKSPSYQDQVVAQNIAIQKLKAMQHNQHVANVDNENNQSAQERTEEGIKSLTAQKQAVDNLKKIYEEKNILSKKQQVRIVKPDQQDKEVVDKLVEEQQRRIDIIKQHPEAFFEGKPLPKINITTTTSTTTNDPTTTTTTTSTSISNDSTTNAKQKNDVKKKDAAKKLSATISREETSPFFRDISEDEDNNQSVCHKTAK